MRKTAYERHVREPVEGKGLHDGTRPRKDAARIKQCRLIIARADVLATMNLCRARHVEQGFAIDAHGLVNYATTRKAGPPQGT